MSAECRMGNVERGQGPLGHVTAACVHGEWTCGLFPFTPALSLGEREKRPRFGARARTFSLSTREAMLFPAHEPPLPPFGHPLPLGGGEGWGEGAARRFKGAMRHQSSGESLPEGERQGEGERAGEKSQSLPAFGKERAHA